MQLTLFDLDNTLLRGDSDYAWGQFLVEQGLVNKEQYEKANQQFYADYEAGTLDIHEFLAFCLKPLSEHSMIKLDRLHTEFMAVKIMPMITEAAQTLVKKHREAGDTLAIITATNEFVTRPIADYFGIKYLMATGVEKQDNRFTGKSEGIPCFAEGKIKKLQSWLIKTGLSFDHVRFYSDSHNDLPLLEWVDEPIVVNPDPKLKDHAEQAAWSIVTLD